MEKQYFHQFRTIEYTAAVRFYAANKFTMWGERKRRRRQTGGEGQGQGDLHEHAAKHEREE